MYVRTVQLAVADGSYSEGWAVFDLDGHTGHERAALMASNLPIVNVAFSSRSIEMWFLLHFGQYQTAFQKVHCKDLRKRELNCNTNIPCLDDGESECLIGFLRRNTPLSNYQKNEDIFIHLNSHLRDAIHNAERLRNTYQFNQLYYQCNPYTTMDFLVKRLYKWISLSESSTINGFRITIQNINPNIKLNITNVSPQRQILQKQHFAFDSDSIDFEFTGGGIFNVNESRIINILPSVYSSKKIKFPANHERDFIWILC